LRLSSAVMVLLSIPILLRVRRPEEALFVGLVWVFSFSLLGQYDYMFLSVVPLMFRKDPRLWQILVLAWVVIAWHSFITTSAIAVDWGYKQISLTIWFYLLITFAWIWHRPDVERSSETALTTV
ncbi:MAG: hypothetical protein VCE43_15440, partial [Myxococcota bacterium]